MKKILYFLITIICISVMIPPASAFADLGDFNDYDSGSNWDSGGGWDSGDSYDWDDDDDYDSGYHSSGSSSSGGSFSTLVAIIIVIIILVVTNRNNGGKGGPSGPSRRTSPPPARNIVVKDNTDEIVTAIQAIDPNYSNDRFIGWVKEVFITLQTAWSERDFAKARPFEKEELYKQHETQIKKYIESNRINVLDRINVNQAYLYKYVRDKEYEYMSVYIQCRMTDYIKDANTGEILKGDPNTEYHLRYLYTFMRKNGVKTDAARSNNSVVACPHCGAPTSITSAGKCEYCGFIVTTGEFDWVLSNIEAIKAGVNINEGGVVIRDGSDKPTEDAENNPNTNNSQNTDNNEQQ